MSNHLFSMAPQANLPRSSFIRNANYKTTLDAGYLVPVVCEEVLPGDTVNFSKISFFSRLNTLAVPLMDNLYLDHFWFFVPNRILWKHWKALMGEKAYPDSSTDYLVPVVNSESDGFGLQSVADYLGVNPFAANLDVSALPFRAYNLIYDTFFRDENLCDPTNMAEETSYGDGPDDKDDYILRKSGKRHDYFTSCLPFQQKTDEPLRISLGDYAPVVGNGMALGITDGTHFTGLTNSTGISGSARTVFGMYDAGYGADVGSSVSSSSSSLTSVMFGVTPDGTKSGLIADLSDATAMLITTLRDTFQMQKILERDARGGTRYEEMLQAHFGVTNPDARMQIPELLHTGTAPISINTVVQNSASVSGQTAQGNLAGYGVLQEVDRGFVKSFTEFGILMCIVRIRADLSYQQGTPRMFFKRDRFDFYTPEFAMISEQPIPNREIYTQGADVVDEDGNIVDELTFGYQEANADYRYMQNKITGKLRSNNTTPADSLDVWHLAQNFTSLPVLSDTFIEENVPMDRVLAVTDEPAFKLDCYFNSTWVREMPTYSVPGLIDHF